MSERLRGRRYNEQLLLAAPHYGSGWLISFAMRDKASLRLSDDARTRAIASLRQYFSTELGQEIGELKAALMLDYFLVEIGPAIYNTAIADAKTFFDERSADLAALCSRDEFTYWPTAAKRRR